jgi:serine/threonine protein phosphatase PrpC
MSKEKTNEKDHHHQKEQNLKDQKQSEKDESKSSVGRYSVAFHIGDRAKMEDIHRVFVDGYTGWNLFIVCDGHGGKYTVELVDRYLQQALLAPLYELFSTNVRNMYWRRKTASSQQYLSSASFQRPTLSTKERAIAAKISPALLRKTLKAAVINLDIQLEKELTTQVERDTGSTMAVFGYNKYSRQYFTINVGDSRVAILIQDGKEKKEHNNLTSSSSSSLRAPGEIRYTIDHKPKEKIELQRIYAAGSFVQGERVGGILALTRAMGDFMLKSRGNVTYDPIGGAVAAEPDIGVSCFHPAAIVSVIVACDGIWDVMNCALAFAIVDEAASLNLDPAPVLVDQAYARGSTDNFTVIVIQLPVSL